MVSAILLARDGFKVALIEKDSYPHHKVCGEYVSNEVKPFLQRHDLFPDNIELPEMKRFILSSVSGKTAAIPLDLGGFGISRYTLDNYIYEKGKECGVDFHLRKQVKNVTAHSEFYNVHLNDGSILQSDLVIGAHGKRSVIDKSLNREFLRTRSGFIGVKYHIKTHQPENTIALHNFEGGYCGIGKVENETYNLCYLGRRDHLKQYGSIQEMEKNILFQNPHLKTIFENSDFLFSEPLVINEFSFKKKNAVEGGILMAGDAAGLITPLCGNGMALAIHSAKILSEVIAKNYKNEAFDKQSIFRQYGKAWNKSFAFRLWTGRTVQHLFGTKRSSEFAVSLIKNSSFVARQIIKNTHGPVF